MVKRLALLIVLLMIGCQLSAAPRNLTKSIVLKNVKPMYIMWSLGLCTQEDAANSNPVIWKSPAVSDSRVDLNKWPDYPVRNDASDLLPAGIEQVLPQLKGNGMVVYGAPSAINELREIIAKLDVEQNKIAIKAEFYELNAEAAKELTSKFPLDYKSSDGSRLITSFSNDKNLDALKARLTELGIESVGAPSAMTFNNFPVQVSAKKENGDKGKSEYDLLLIPRINVADNSITLNVKVDFIEISAEVEGVPMRSQSSLETIIRVAAGDSLLLIGTPKEPGKDLLIIITPAVVK